MSFLLVCILFTSKSMRYKSTMLTTFYRNAVSIAYYLISYCNYQGYPPRGSLVRVLLAANATFHDIYEALDHLINEKVRFVLYHVHADYIFNSQRFFNGLASTSSWTRRYHIYAWWIGRITYSMDSIWPVSVYCIISFSHRFIALYNTIFPFL